jgi:hypothetical protein
MFSFFGGLRFSLQVWQIADDDIIKVFFWGRAIYPENLCDINKFFNKIMYLDLNQHPLFGGESRFFATRQSFGESV